MQRVKIVARQVVIEEILHQDTVGAARQRQQQVVASRTPYRHLAGRDTGPELQGVGLRGGVVFRAQGVLPVAAVKQEGVVPGAASEDVVAGAARQDIVPAAAIEGVVAFPSNKCLFLRETNTRLFLTE